MLTHSRNLKIQIETFTEDKNQDNDELLALLKQNKARTSHVDLTNNDEIFKAISSNVRENKHLQNALNSILRDLLMLPQDQSSGLKQWLIVQRFVVLLSLPIPFLLSYDPYLSIIFFCCRLDCRFRYLCSFLLVC